jgi:hypothetical protein
MSSDSFEDFLKTLREDAGLQKELRAKYGKPADKIPIERLAEFAAGRGYKFNVEELSGRLSDGQLDAVSGGALNAYLKLKGQKQG